MKFYIKNMVCIRCIKIVEAQLEKIGIKNFTIQSGEAVINDNLSDDQLNHFMDSIQEFGLEVIEDRVSIIIEKIKNSINELIYSTEDNGKINLSENISRKLGYDYHYLSNLFSSSHGSTIEKYYIKQRIERVKELLIYSELSLSEIAYKVHYSSIAHLSGQFKKETGLTPSYFRKLNHIKIELVSNL